MGWGGVVGTPYGASVKVTNLCCTITTLPGRVNAISAEMLNGEYSEGCLGGTGARVWLIIGLVCSFGSFVASIWVMVAAYLQRGTYFRGQPPS